MFNKVLFLEIWILRMYYNKYTEVSVNPTSPVRYAIFQSISIFCKIPLLISISIFSRTSILISIFSRMTMSISISIFFKLSLSISIPMPILSKFPYQYFYRYRYFQKMLIDILSISIFSQKSSIFYRYFKKCRYIDNQYRYFIKRTWKITNLLKTLPEAQRTQGIDSLTRVISPAK